MSKIRLVTRADDAGISAVANRAVRDTVTQGIVRNISLMAPAPAIRSAYDYLGDLSDRVDFGVHVTLTAEWQNMRWRPLTGSDRSAGFVRKDGTMHMTVAGLSAMEPDLDAIMEEVSAQYDLLSNLGFDISYLDEHMNVGDIPGLAEHLEEFAREHRLISNRRLASEEALIWLPGWEGPGEHPGTELADYLSQTEGGTYLLVGHPATKDEEMQAFRLEGQSAGEVAIERNRERRMFMDIEIVDYCENVGIELLRYSDIPSG